MLSWPCSLLLRGGFLSLGGGGNFFCDWQWTFSLGVYVVDQTGQGGISRGGDSVVGMLCSQVAHLWRLGRC